MQEIFYQGQTRKLLRKMKILIEFLKNDITKSDIVTLGYRKQLSNFEKLLNDQSILISLNLGTKSMMKVMAVIFERIHGFWIWIGHLILL